MRIVRMIARRLRRLIHHVGAALIDRRNYSLVRRSRFEEMLDALIEDPGFYFIQVGAHDGVRFDSLYGKVTTVDVHGIVIEPLKRYFDRLKMNYEDYPGVVPLNVALHPTLPRVEIFHVAPEALRGLPPWAGGIGSVVPTHHARSHTPAAGMTSTVVEAMNFTELLDRFHVQRVDLLQIDVEGFDVEILKMFPFARLKPTLVKFEHDSLDALQQSDAAALLDRHGYEVFMEGEDTVAILRPGTGVS
jgi:FkbM family methyltransferase